MSFCQYNRKLSSILSFFGSSQRVARGGVKRPCKRERAFFLRKTCSQIGQWMDKRNNEQDSHTRLARPAVLLPCLLRTSFLPYAPSSSCTRHARHTRIACALPCIACITRPAACCLRCALYAIVCPLPTARHGKHEIRGKTA